MVDTGGRVVTWNAGAERMTGYTRDEIVGHSTSRLYADEDVRAGKPMALLRTALEAGRVADVGWRVRKDGSQFWADVAITATRDDTGALLGFANVTRDLTQRRMAEENLRLSEERFHLLVDAVEDYAIFLLDPAGRVVTWNEGARRLKGYTAEEIVGEHFSRFYPPAVAASGACEVKLATALREGRFAEEGWRVRKDGTRFCASVTITPVRDREGALVGFAKVTRDLTERRRLEQEQIRAAQAREAVRLRDEFLSIAAHELKTPLTVLQLQLNGVRDRIAAVDAQTATKVDRATRGGERLVDLVDALLDVSRIATGRLVLNPQPFDLTEAIGDVVESFRDFALKAGCTVSFAAEGPVPGLWDPLRIDQVVMNLLSNAVKYGARAPVDVSVAQRGATALVEVRDRGPGLRETDLPRIFGRFERGAPMRNYGGLGLGLYLAREIAEAHGGSVSARNAPGGGATFTVELPVVARAAPASRTA